MKSTEVYNLVRDEVLPWAKAEGFKRTKTMLSWSRPHGDKNVVFWFQVSRDGWDDYAGSKFTVEFQLSSKPEVGSACVHRQRIGWLLTDAARQELTMIQNNVILSLPKPPSEHLARFLSETVRDWYLQKFQPVTTPYTQADDIWFRYHTGEQVHLWGQFVLRQLPACIPQVQEWGVPLKEYDIVEVIRPPQGKPNIKVGDMGAVVMVLRNASGKEAYEVECVTKDGKTVWLETLERFQIRHRCGGDSQQ